MSSTSLRLAALRASLATGKRPTPPVLRSFASSPLTSAKDSPPAPLPPHLLTLADLSTSQIQTLISSASAFKSTVKAYNHALLTGSASSSQPPALEQTLKNKTIALLFTKRSTRTRVASETSTTTLGGHSMFLGPSDIQLGVNESLYDTAKVVGSMVDGIMARVDGHEEVELLAKHAGVPIINALSDLYHPTQILADLLTMVETCPTTTSSSKNPASLSSLAGLKVAWVGDSNNILNDMLVALPRFGIHMSVATPKGYERNERVWGTMQDGINEERKKGGSATVATAEWTHHPKEAVRDADIIVTDTWISMGEESSKDQRLRDFAGFQVTEALAREGGAKGDWKFMHCLPRKSQEVDDEVFYGNRSIVFPEAENRKWTIMAVFDAYMGRWKI